MTSKWVSKDKYDEQMGQVRTNGYLTSSMTNKWVSKDKYDKQMGIDKYDEQMGI